MWGSSGQAVPCRAETPVCKPPPGGLQGIHGKPLDEARRMWRDERRGSIITAIPTGRGTLLLYRPTGR